MAYVECKFKDNATKNALCRVVPLPNHDTDWIPMTGAQMVMPGPNLDGESLVKLIDDQRVTIALGVPTIWLGLLGHAKAAGSSLDSL